MRAFLITFFVLIIAFVIIVLIKLAQSMLRLLYIKKYISETEENPMAISKMFAVLCGKKNVFKNVFLPSAEQQSVNLVKSDYILVNRGGIIIVTVKKMKGYIENPMRGDWRQFRGDKIVQFENPFETNTNIMRAIYALLEREDFSDIPVKGITVFTSPKVTYKNKFSQVISPSRASEMIDGIDKTNTISKSTVRELSCIIGAARRTPPIDMSSIKGAQSQNDAASEAPALKNPAEKGNKVSEKAKRNRRKIKSGVETNVFCDLKKETPPFTKKKKSNNVVSQNNRNKTAYSQNGKAGTESQVNARSSSGTSQNYRK